MSDIQIAPNTKTCFLPGRGTRLCSTDDNYALHNGNDTCADSHMTVVNHYTSAGADLDPATTQQAKIKAIRRLIFLNAVQLFCDLQVFTIIPCIHLL